MLWEIEILPKEADSERDRVHAEFALLTHRPPAESRVDRTSHGYLLEGPLDQEAVERFTHRLLVDPLVETGRIHRLDPEKGGNPPSSPVKPEDPNTTPLTVLLKPGVMDPVAMSVTDTGRDLDIDLDDVRTFRRYYGDFSRLDKARSALFKVLANDAIEQIVEGPLVLAHLRAGHPYQFRAMTVRLAGLEEEALARMSREGQLSLSIAEMKTIQQHFEELGRDPTDIELETLAQTWSEHCSHKTLKGVIEYQGQRIDNLLKATIFGATQTIRQRLGAEDWCVSVFEDNAGIVRFTDRHHVCFKVETHNHPSAIEPYGGANTGLGGVIRDVLGTGLGAKPVCNTDVFCFAPPDTPPETLPPGVLHPKKVMKGVVAGVRDYGNRMGIPTVNGAICFDERYLANPLVFCGTVGLIPVERAHKQPQQGDLIVAVGGRTGRDGIHGATFSSVELTAESETVSGGAVQIGNAITEKKMMDVLLQARDLGLYHAITDCGAGGFSSAVGEMGERLGAEVHLENAPLKYEGLSYTEIWISESQERMVLAVPPAQWPRLRALCAGEDVEATSLGTFDGSGRLRLYYQDHQVGDLAMSFLHDGRPRVTRKAIPPASPPATSPSPVSTPSGTSLSDVLKALLGSLNVCSKEWVIRQYDHEVQGGTVIKPLVGVACDGPGDAAVITPVLGLDVGLAVGCGLNPLYGDLDPYAMAAAAVDEAVRNVVAVGADPQRIALLDNFCWGNTDRPEMLGALVRAAEACRDVALAYNTPFISGKDSLNNEYYSGDRHIAIPHTLLISALGRVPDITRSMTMDLKEPGNLLFLLGTTRDELGGSHYYRFLGQQAGIPPQPNLQTAPAIFLTLHQSIRNGWVRACHDLSEGGLAVAVAEMAFAGGLGADITQLKEVAGEGPDEVALFSESTTRFLVEVRPTDETSFRQACTGIPLHAIGQTVKEQRLRIAGKNGEWLIWSPLADLKETWQKPLRW